MLFFQAAGALLLTICLVLLSLQLIKFWLRRNLVKASRIFKQLRAAGYDIRSINHNATMVMVPVWVEGQGGQMQWQTIEELNECQRVPPASN